jgi:hypothetical protein
VGDPAALVLERVREESDLVEPPACGPRTLARRVNAVHEALIGADPLALEDALASVAASSIAWLGVLRARRLS